MKPILIRSALAALPLLALACGGGGGGEATFTIQSCSLGCNSGTTGVIACSFQGIHVNEEIVVKFSAPVNLGTVTKNTFIVTDSTGIAPVGEYRIGDTPNEVVFRPIVVFDSSGNPIFGLEANETYEITIPGKQTHPNGPWIMSTSGKANSIGLNCFLVASQGVLDLSPGPPSVQVIVRQVTAYANNDPTQDPIAFQDTVANAGTEISHVSRDTEIRMIFNDIMNPATLANPISGKSEFIQVRIDPDGNTSDASDQLDLFGTFLPPLLDNDNLQTTLIFRLDKGLPSAGGIPFLPGQPIPPGKRRVVVQLSTSIRDLGGNKLLNAGAVSFVPEVLTFQTAVLPDGSPEPFLSSSSNQDQRNSARGMWGAIEDQADGVGLLAPGPRMGSSGFDIVRALGGSGRLGRLEVKPGVTRYLGTTGTEPKQITGIPISTTDSPFFVWTSPTTTQPVAAVGRVRWEQQQIFGIEPDWQMLGMSGPPTIAVQVEAEDPANPGEFSPVWIGNDGMTPMTMNVVAANYSNTFVLDNYDPDTEAPGTGFYSASGSFTGGPGADGLFEFSSLRVRTGGRIVFRGDLPARLFTRGELEVQGVCDVAGDDAPTHSSVLRLGSVGAKGGPGAGQGGKGGDRYDHAQGAFEYLNFFALPIPGKILVGLAINEFFFGIDNVDDFETDGLAGGGVGNSTAPDEGGGRGGVSWPELYPGEIDETTYTGLLSDIGDMEFDNFSCQSPQIGAPGGGGANLHGVWPDSSNQGVGVAQTAHSGFGNPPPNPVPPLPGDTPGADVSGLSIGGLDPELGLLRGGGAGGGGGGHNRFTRSNGTQFINCTAAILPPFRIIELSDHSGAGGGGGGGALQAQAGRLLNVTGVVDATGGNGGSKDPSQGVFDDYKRQAMPGGGGAGGTLLLQAPVHQIATIAGRLDVSGGLGGTGEYSTKGGDGGAGIVRFERTPGSVQDLTLLESLLIAGNIVKPGQSSFNGAYPPDIILTGTAVEKTIGPGAFSGVQSCWMQPQGNFFIVDFEEDGAALGWDMDVVFVNGETQSFRTPITTGPFAGTSLEELFGSILRDPDDVATAFNSSPIVVRFQGARAVKDLAEPCNVLLDGSDGVVLPNSVTAWVYHPAELNDYWDSVSGLSTAEKIQRRSNMIRFQVIFDGANPAADLVLGVTELGIRALPD